MKERIIKIMQELYESSKAVKIRITDDTIFSEACSIYRGEKAGEQKQYYKKQKNDSREKEITEKQKEFLDNNKKKMEQLGFNINDIQYRSQANKIIGEFIKLNKKKE